MVKPKFVNPAVDVAGFDRLPDLHLLGCTLYGEARGQSVDEIIAVGEVIMNRVHDGRYGAGIRGVCLKRLAFSCWWEDSRNRTLTLRMVRCLLTAAPFETLSDVRAWRTISALVPGIVAGAFPHVVDGCLHYHTVPDSTHGLWPKWAAWQSGKRPDVVIGPFKFYRLIDGPKPQR